MNIDTRLAKLEQAKPTGPSAREHAIEQAHKLQEFVESNGELIEQRRREVCPAYGELANRMNETKGV